MNINEIAKKILHLRETKMTGFIMAGVLREELGFEGYGEALRRRWIEADMDQSGMVTISNNLGVIESIRQLAAECKDKCGTCGKASCKCDGRCDSCNGDKCTCEAQKPAQEAVSETAHFFAQAHAFRRNAVGENEGMGEAATLGLGRTGDAPNVPVPGLGAQSAQAPAPAAATPQRPPGQPMDRGQMSMNIVQAETVAKTKFGKSFAQLSPDQQMQIEREIQAMTPSAR